MANIKSSIKRARQSEKRRLHNRAIRSDMRTAIKKAEQLIEQKEVEAAQDAVRIAAKKLDQAASKGLIHKNKANRHKSALMKKFNQISQGA